MLLRSEFVPSSSPLSVHPTKGGKHMTKLRIQAPVMSNLAFLEVIKLGYFIGCVTAMYRSSDITTRCKMDAVHIQTSTASQIEHLKKVGIQS